MAEVLITDITTATAYNRKGEAVKKTRVSFEYQGKPFYVYIDGEPTNEEIAEAVKRYVKERLGLLGKAITV